MFNRKLINRIEELEGDNESLEENVKDLRDDIHLLADKFDALVEQNYEYNSKKVVRESAITYYGCELSSEYSIMTKHIFTPKKTTKAKK